MIISLQDVLGSKATQITGPFRLRWCFDYVNRPSKFGMWDKDPVNENEKACRQLKDGLLMARIEGKDVLTLQVVTLAECPGSEFVNFKWMAEFSARRNIHTHVGMQLVTRYSEISVLREGVIRKEPRTEEDMGFHYEIFGR